MPSTATVSTFDGITLCSLQKLTNGILLLDNYLVTFIDIVYLFPFSLVHIVTSHVLLDWNYSLWLIDWLTYEENCFVKIYLTICLYCPQQPRLELGWLSCIWGLCSWACITPISSLDDLKDRVRTCWANLDQQIIDKFIDHWRDKLKVVVRLNGGHTEQLFSLSGAFAAVVCSVCVLRT